MEDIKFIYSVFLEMKEKEDSELIERLISNNFEISMAEKLVIFIPIVFGRVYLNDKYINLEFTNYY